ncbi:MAG: hypothetical protein KTR25_16805 [Myxococcales bacterium]|nr:hypothetical protein [Myxococcales bacterium]
MRSPNVWVGFLYLTLMSSTMACSLLESDFEGSVTLNFVINDIDQTYRETELFNPNDNEDFADNRDNIKDGTIESMVFTFRDVQLDNAATILFGQAHVSRAGSVDDNDYLVEGVTAWDGFKVEDGARYFVDIPAENQEALSDLIFSDDPLEAIDIHIDGGADRGPVRLGLDVRLNLAFTAGP